MKPFARRSVQQAEVRGELGSTRRLTRRPSPSMAVALTALFVALGGTGYATTRSAGTAATATVTKPTSPHGRRGPRGPRGARGAQGAQGPQGPRGLKGDTGPAGAAATALGYAKVNLDGTVVMSESKNVTSANVVKTGPGGASYCFIKLPFTPNSVMATNDYNLSAYTSIVFATLAAELPATTGCPAGTQAMVGTSVAGAPAPSPFYVLFN